MGMVRHARRAVLWLLEFVLAPWGHFIHALFWDGLIKLSKRIL